MDRKFNVFFEFTDPDHQKLLDMRRYPSISIFVLSGQTLLTPLL